MAARRPHAASLAVALAVALAAAAPAGAQVVYKTATTDANRVGLTLTNYGFLGNNFVTRTPSFEFPLGSGYEHMSRAGLWVGAIALSDTGFFTGVSSAIVDNAQGSNSQSETEFTPVTPIRETSRIGNSPHFSADALSDQDFTCQYADRPAKPASGYQGEAHTPLGILVRQRALSFSLDVADAFVVTQFTIVNQGPRLRNVYLAMYAQLVSGNKSAYPSWPPSANSGPGTWYYKTYAEYDSTRHLYKERFCQAQPYPAGCNVAYCPPWAGVKLLRATGGVATKTVSLNWWSYSPADSSRDTDVKRYAIMSNGEVMDPRTCIPGGQCSPIALLSVGPFAAIDPGDSVTVDFAFVGGEDEQHLLDHADYAQFASDIDYQLPTPPPSPRLHVATGDHRIDLYWDDSPERTPDPTSPAKDHLDFEGYRVYLSSDRQRLNRIFQYDLVDTTGFNTGLDSIRIAPVDIDGVTYRYHKRIEGLRDGFTYFGAVTAYDTGDPQIPSLESGITQNKFAAVPNPAPGERSGVTVYPNPYRVEARWDQGANVRDHYLWFANLPRHCVLRIYTLAGDLVFDTRLDGDTYHGFGTQGLYDPNADRDTGPPALSGASFAWDLITRQGQATATGLYIYSVQDLDGGSVQRGKFLVVKSDRE